MTGSRAQRSTVGVPGAVRHASAAPRAGYIASCPGRSAARSDALQTRDRSDDKRCCGPGSAAHHSLRSCCAAPGTRSW